MMTIQVIEDDSVVACWLQIIELQVSLVHWGDELVLASRFLDCTEVATGHASEEHVGPHCGLLQHF